MPDLAATVAGRSAGVDEASVMTHSELRRQLVAVAEQLVSGGVLSQSGHANISARIGDDAMLMTVRGSVVGVTAEELAVVTFGGDVREGELTKENEAIVQMHAVLYRERPDVGAVLHAHPPHVTAFALANRSIPARLETLLNRGQTRDVPVVPWAPRSSPRLVASIQDALTANPDTYAVVLGNHGVLAFGKNLAEGARLLTALEECAQAEILATSIGGACALPALV